MHCPHWVQCCPVCRGHYSVHFPFFTCSKCPVHSLCEIILSPCYVCVKAKMGRWFPENLLIFRLRRSLFTYVGFIVLGMFEIVLSTSNFVTISLRLELRVMNVFSLSERLAELESLTLKETRKKRFTSKS